MRPPWKKCADRRGVTLTEVIVTSLILGLLSLLVAPIITNLTRYFSSSSARIAMNQESRAAIQIISKFLRQARIDSVQVTNGPAGALPFSGISFQTVQNQNHEFYQDGKELVMIPPGGGKRILSRNLDVLAFTFPDFINDPRTISISVCLRAPTFEGRTRKGGFINETVIVQN